jgi:ribosomal protein S14
MIKKRISFDKSKRNLKKKKEINILILKFILKSNTQNNLDKSIIRYLNDKLHKKNINFQPRNYCLITNRSRGICSFWGLSRISLRKLASLGLITGLRKSSW